MKRIKELEVRYNNKRVGLLKDIDGQIAFEYFDEWISNGFSISPLSLPLEKRLFFYDKHDLDIFGVFYDSMPDGWGEFLMIRELHHQGIDYQKLSILEKLALVNEEGLGGLSYYPHTFIDQEELCDCDLDDLNKTIKEILVDQNDLNIDKVYRWGGSSGGSRPKAHVKIDGNSWIIKFRSSQDPLNMAKEEYAANELATKCQINVNEHRLFKTKNGEYFGAKRFDRLNDKRVHMISVSSLLETSFRIPNLDYGHIFQLVEKISVDKEADKYEMFKRMAFNVLYKNRDDHGHNFAFIYDEDRQGYCLSPFYDITSTPEILEHQMTVNLNGLPGDEDMLALAKHFGLNIPKCKEIILNIKNIINE